MREIQLTKGYVALIDDEDYDRLIKFSWSADVHENGLVYAHCYMKDPNGTKRTVRMHRFIAGVDSRIDHKDGNGLNNQKCNLRAATLSQNAANSKGRYSTSIFKGVSWSGSRKRWCCQVHHKGKHVFNRYFREESDAATAYNFVAYEIWGEFAKMNTIQKAARGGA